MVEVPGPDGPLPAYRARPAGGEGLPVVLVVHEIFGLHAYIRDVCRRLAKAGHLAVAPDLYRRHGDVSKLTDIGQILDRVVRRVPDAEVLADLDASLSWTTRDAGDPERAAVTGFCWGGRIVWLYAAHRPELRAGAAWYGRLEGARGSLTPSHPLDVAERLHAPVLGLYGAEDRGIPLPSVEAMRKRLAAGDYESRRSEIQVFPGAPHGFHADYRASYRAAAAQEGWRRMLEWFGKYGAA